MQVIFILP